MKKLSLKEIKKIVPIRKSDSHKGTYGKVLIIGSSLRYPGAGCICASSCMRSGSGLVTLAVEDEIFPIISTKMSEVMILNIDKYYLDFSTLVTTSDSIAIGCGLGDRDYTYKRLEYALIYANCPILIDADAINVISNNPDLLENRNSNSTLIFTPHIAEFSRLSGYKIDEIISNKEQLSIEFAKKYQNVILILKGAQTIITNGEELYVSDIGVPQMATGGMGDCLSGMITSFIGQNIPVLDACKLGVYTHSYIARKLSKDMNSVLAADIIEQIPYTLSKFVSKK